MGKKLNILSPNSKSRINIFIAVVIALAIIVVGYVLQLSRASGFYSSAEAESGTVTANAKVITDTTASGGKAVQFTAPVPTPPPVTGDWPAAYNTGVPHGIAGDTRTAIIDKPENLPAYTGPCTITAANTIIDGKKVNCGLDIRAANVTIKNSLVIGGINSTNGPDNYVTIYDSEISGDTDKIVTISNQYITLNRVNVYGGEGAVGCAFNCNVYNSWLHGQFLPKDGDWHLDGFISNGGREDGSDSEVVLSHNTIACDNPGSSNGGGCSGNVGLFPDFAPLVGFTFDHNLFVSTDALNSGSSSYCIYGGAQLSKPYGSRTSHILVKNNVFQHGNNGQCGHLGAVSYWANSNPVAGTFLGNEWTNNTWDDGTPLSP